eukprot:6718090-Pyramimonas_sp.AAC.1
MVTIDARVVPELAAAYSDRLRWRRVAVGAWRRAGAVHNEEARAALLGLRRYTRSSWNWDAEILSVGDN